jgi:hypothetical protein
VCLQTSVISISTCSLIFCRQKKKEFPSIQLFICLTLCRIIGAALIIAGLYFVLWGKSEERALAAKEAAAAARGGGGGTICDDEEAASCLKQALLPPATPEAV